MFKNVTFQEVAALLVVVLAGAALALGHGTEEIKVALGMGLAYIFGSRTSSPPA